MTSKTNMKKIGGLAVLAAMATTARLHARALDVRWETGAENTNLVAAVEHPMPHKPNHHMTLDFQWTVHEDAEGGVLLRFAARPGTESQPVFAILLTASGAWRILPNDQPLAPADTARFAGTPGTHAASARVYTSSRTAIAGAPQQSWDAPPLDFSDFTRTGILEATLFGRNISLDAARLAWKPNNTLFMVR